MKCKTRSNIMENDLFLSEEERKQGWVIAIRGGMKMKVFDLEQNKSKKIKLK